MKIESIVDLIVIITLKDRKDRHLELKKNLASIKLKKVKYFLAKRHKKGSVYGSFDSHLKVIKYAYLNNYKNVLILEDDVCFDTKNFLESNILEKVNYFLNENKKWDLFFLGGMPYCKFDNYNSYIMESEWILAHSYIVNRKCMKYILNHKRILPYQFSFVDYYYIILNKLNKFGLKKSIIFQTDSPGDNNWPIYLIIYKKICNLLNVFFFNKTTIFVMIVLLENIWNLIPEKIVRFFGNIKKKYNIFRYYFFYHYGDNIPDFYFHYFLPI